jgi:dienelactone hydrolase
MSVQTGMGACCLSGFVHSGTPTGREETVGGLPTYVAEPADKSKAKTVIFLVDIFGWKGKNVRLLADNYAKAGFYCYIPDVQQGDYLNEELLQSIEPPLKKKEQDGFLDKAKETVDVMVHLGPWLVKHREGVAEPIISGFVDEVKKIPGTGKIGGE